MTQRLIVILACPDTLMWYRHLVGSTVPLVRDLPADNCYMSRDLGGHLNIVKYADGVAVPDGYRVLRHTELLQHGDLVMDRLSGRRPALSWRTVDTSRLATPVNTDLAIRKELCDNHG